MKHLLRIILGLAIGAAIARAQGLVTVNAVPPITRANGSLASGTMSIQWQDFTTATGIPVVHGALNINISSGVFSTAVQLYPNVGATPPGTTYTILYNLSGSTPYTRRWYIPATTSVNVVQIELPPPGLVGTTAIVSPSQLTQAGATTNQALCWNGAFWAPGSCGGGGGGSGTVNTGLINQLAYYAAAGTTVSGVGPGTSTQVLHGGVPSYSQVVGADIANATIDVTTKITGIEPVANGGTGTSTAFTAGSIPFAGTGGPYQQNNSKLFWDNTNFRLGVGTLTPTMALDVRTGSTDVLNVQSTGSFADVWLTDTGTTPGSIRLRSRSGVLSFANNGNFTSLMSTGNLLVGCSSAVEGNFHFDVQCSGSAGTARFFDNPTGVPGGSTRVVIQAGALQSTDNLLSFANNSGTTQSYVDSSYQFISPQFISSVTNGASLQNRLNLASVGGVQWSSTSVFSGTPDTRFERTSAGTVELNNATSGHRYGTVFQVGSATLYDNTPTTGFSHLIIQAGAGQAIAPTDLVTFADSSGLVIGGLDSSADFYAKSVFDSYKKKVAFVGGNSMSIVGGSVDLSSDSNLRWRSVSDLDAGGTYDTNLSRISAGLVGVGTGAPASFAGSLKLTGLTIAGITGSTQCLHVDTNGAVTGTGSDCGSGSTGANTALSNLASVSINTALLAQTGVDLGSTVKPFRDAYIVGSGTFGTNYFKFTGLPSAARTITIPDFTANLAGTTGTLTSGNGVQIDASGRLIDSAAPPNNPTVQAACTGAATANVTLVIQLYPPTTCTITSAATANAVGVLASRTGVIRNLRVHADVGGISGSSGVVTVNISGVGATAVTCTLGTSTTCSDTTHSVAITAGQLATVFVGTQPGETLASLNIAFEF